MLHARAHSYAANIARIMKRRVPEPNKISKEAKEGAQEACSEFVHFLVSEAVERCQTEKRKTIGGDDILLAMNALGFDSYLMPLKHYLERYAMNVCRVVYPVRHRYRQAMRGTDAKDPTGGAVHDDEDDEQTFSASGGQAVVMDDQQQHDELVWLCGMHVRSCV
jgi:histone H3/H4